MNNFLGSPCLLCLYRRLFLALVFIKLFREEPAVQDKEYTGPLRGEEADQGGGAHLGGGDRKRHRQCTGTLSS